MKKVLVTLLMTLVLSGNLFAQLLVDTDGKVFVGPRIIDNFDLDGVLSMSITGPNGNEYGFGGKLAFGDFGTLDNLGWNVFIGEYGNYDSDQLWLHGKKGIIVSNLGNSEIIAQLGMDPDSRSIFYYPVYLPHLYQVLPNGGGNRAASTPLNNALNRLLQLNSLTYRDTMNSTYTQNPQQEVLDTVRQSSITGYGIGLSELERLFPSLVISDSNGMKSVNYLEMIPVIVAALQEQQNTIQYLTASLLELQRTCCCPQDSTGRTDESSKGGRPSNQSQGETPRQTEALLYQNTPNPFTSATTIEYCIPVDARDATLYVFNLNGVLMQTLPITTTGHGSVSVSASTLTAGMYIYTLAVNGNIMDSKRMILTE